MFYELLGEINWVDILYILICIRIIYIALKRRLIVEFFKFLGTACSVILAFHYYHRAATFISDKCPLPLNISIVVSFIFLVFAGTIIFKLILGGVGLLFRIEPKPFLEKWGAFVFSILRAALVCSLISAFFIISTINYLDYSVKFSFLGSRLVNLSPTVYRATYIHIISRLLPDEPLNFHVFDTILQRGPLDEEIEEETRGET